MGGEGRGWSQAGGLMLAVGAMMMGLGVAPVHAADVTIGAVEILTGPNAAYGNAIRGGLLLALDEINAAGGVLGGKLAIEIEDSTGTKEGAVNAARKLIGQTKAPLIIGPTLSTEMFAVGPVANERKIPIIGTSTTAVGVTAIGDYVFRTSLPESDVIPVTLKTAQAKFGVKKIALMYANDDNFSKSGFDTMKSAAEKLGMEIVTIETFGSKDRDFSAQLTKIKSLDPDAIGVSALVEPDAGVALQARQLGLPDHIRMIGGNGSNSPKLGVLAGAAADGWIVGSPWFVGKPDPVNAKFVAAYKARYDSNPDQFAAQAYDTLFIVAEAINRAGAAEPDKLREALLKTEHNGVMGPFRFTPGRDPASTEGIVVLQMNGGAFGLLP